MGRSHLRKVTAVLQDLARSLARPAGVGVAEGTTTAAPAAPLLGKEQVLLFHLAFLLSWCVAGV